jgi:hypothetical protein
MQEVRMAALHLILGVAAQQQHHFIIDTICVRPLCRECCPAFVPWKFSCREAANPAAMFRDKTQQPSTSLQQGRTLVDAVSDVDEIPFS